MRNTDLKSTGRPIGSYRVTARLAGFDNVTRDGVNIVADNVARLDVAMRVSAICECVRLGGTTLAEQWDHADAVLHVRLSASESQPTTPVGYYRHIAMVIDALKKPAASLETPVFVVQNQRSAAPDPYDIDQKLVVFLRSSQTPHFVKPENKYCGRFATPIAPADFIACRV